MEADKFEELDDLLERIQQGYKHIDAAMQKLHSMEVRALILIRDKYENGATPLVKLFSQARNASDTLEAGLKPIKGVTDQLKVSLIPEAFEREEIRTQTTVSGDRIGLSTRVVASVRAGAKEEAYKWLRDTGNESLIVETVNSSTLGSFARTMAEEGKDLPEEMFNVMIRQEATLTRGKNK